MNNIKYRRQDFTWHSGYPQRSSWGAPTASDELYSCSGWHPWVESKLIIELGMGSKPQDWLDEHKLSSAWHNFRSEDTILCEWTLNLQACQNVCRSAYLCWCVWTCQWYLDAVWSQVWKLGDASFRQCKSWWSRLTPSSWKENIEGGLKTHPCIWRCGPAGCYKGPYHSDSMVVLDGQHWTDWLFIEAKTSFGHC